MGITRALRDYQEVCAHKGEGQGGSEEEVTFEGYYNSEGDWGKREARGECHTKASIIEYRGLPGEGAREVPTVDFLVRQNSPSRFFSCH